MADLAARLADHNALLAAAGIALRLERRGQRLGLRGPLPCRADGERLAVQRISLGLPASEAGLMAALGQLQQVVAQLQAGTFDWSQWERRGSRAPAAPAPPPGGPAAAVADRLAAFEAAFFADPRRRRNPAGTRTTWTAAYRPYLRRLARLAEQQGLPLGLELLEHSLESYDLGSRSRQQAGTALAALARHLELELPADWSERAGGYGLHAAQFRRLPSDAQILQLIEQIPNPAWRLAYGLMATYGLRNHEVFFADLSALAPGGDRVIRVLPTSKTGEHQVWPFQPEWVERFELERLGADPALLPAVRTDLRRTTLQQVGRRVAEQFRRYALPITPYDLRHAWAVRTIHIGLPDTVAARMMGHSVAIHTRTYHHWITRRDQQQAVDAALARARGGRQQVA
jgi:integrase